MAYGQGEGKYNYYKDFDGISSNDDYAYGSSQFVSLEDIIDYFMVAYVGADKIIKRIKKHEVNFHAKRNLAELSFDTFKSFHAQEMVLGASLSMPLPHDYVNYTKIAWSDDSGIEHIIYPTNKTSNPLSILQDSDGGYGIKEKVSYTAGSTTATISSVNKNIKNGMNYSSGFASGQEDIIGPAKSVPKDDDKTIVKPQETEFVKPKLGDLVLSIVSTFNKGLHALIKMQYFLGILFHHS